MLSATKTRHIQSVVKTILYYALAVDPTMMAAIGSIAIKQSKATSRTSEACNWFMEYSASNPLAITRYTYSGMVLYIHSGASFISESWKRSRAVGHFFLSDNPTNPIMPTIGIPPLKVPVYT